MTSTTITLPRLGETVDEAYVTEFLVEAGTTVEEGTPLLRMETDKAIVDVPSPTAGVLAEWLVELDQEVATGQAIATLTTA